MSNFEDIAKGYASLALGTANEGLIYTCNCGWLDLGHAFSPSKDKTLGARNLWLRVKAGGRDAKVRFGHFYPPGFLAYRYGPSVLQAMRDDGDARFPDGAMGFAVTFREVMGKHGLSAGIERRFLVRHHLTILDLRRVALSVFAIVSWKFENFQHMLEFGGIINFFSRLTGGGHYDSGFSHEDLTSDLIGFYVAVGEMTKQQALALCHPVSQQAAERIWGAEGPVGARKNESFAPDLAPPALTNECAGQPRSFPAQFKTINPMPFGQNLLALRD